MEEEEQEWWQGQGEPEEEATGIAGSFACLREEMEDDGGLRTLEHNISEEEAAKTNYKGQWIKIEAEMDTGACMPMMPKSVAKHLPVRESEGSKKGAKYLSASDGCIYNEGESEVVFANNLGEWKKAVVQRGDVNKTLMAGGSVADKGNTLLFTKYGGMVVEDPDLTIYKRAVGMAKRKTPFQRKGKTYSMNMWLKVPGDAAGGARRMSDKEERQINPDENAEMERLMALAAENGWKVVGPKGKAIKGNSPTFGGLARR